MRARDTEVRARAENVRRCLFFLGFLERRSRALDVSGARTDVPKTPGPGLNSGRDGFRKETVWPSVRTSPECAQSFDSVYYVTMSLFRSFKIILYQKN